MNLEQKIAELEKRIAEFEEKEPYLSPKEKKVSQLQQLKAEITIPIPADHVLVSKVEFEELQKQTLSGVYWGMKDLERRGGKKQDWIKENILFQPRFRKMLDVENGGFVFYPQSKGQNWSFQASKMAEFLEKHFADIFSRR